GYGCVGQGFVQLLKDNPSVDAEISKVCVKHKNKARPGLTGEVVYEPDLILDDAEISIIVELIDDAQAAFEIVAKAIRQGKKVISANKKMIAENLEVLEELQKEFDGRILYEGAVCGSIPIIGSLRNYYRYSNIISINGIFNGSTNYILTKVIDEKLSYEEALQQAKENGFAESDPSLDVGGYDPSFKLSILIRHCFDTIIDPDDILRIGIEQISKADVKFAEENSLKIKLIAHAEISNGLIRARVTPQFVDSSSQYASVEAEYNAVEVSSEAYGQQLLVGKGAGKLPTGLAVLSDVAASLNSSFKLEEKRKAQVDKTQFIEVYVGYDSTIKIDWSYFSSLKEKYIGHNYSHTIGLINVKELSKFAYKYPEASIILTSGQEKENGLSRLTYNNTTVTTQVGIT
ncbi:homoserine dehydrogenase, partial [Fulvivirga sp. RKSG066]|uniref:homoserine dehydrogenase n=1 Tax=Fulvivirga aurantia TaxID=2529383 RepID=UPI0012BC5794